MLQEFLDMLFPRRRLKDPMGYWANADDWANIPFNPLCEERCVLRSRGIHFLDRLLSASSYDDSQSLQRAIQTYKYRKVHGLTYRLAELIVRAGYGDAHQDIVFSSVPLHWMRRMQRGFNQSSLLARHVARATDLPYRSYLLRTRETGHQAWRERRERMVAMRGAFTVLPFVRVPEIVVLVDDIATTGATLDACAFALKNAGAKLVDAWVVARG